MLRGRAPRQAQRWEVEEDYPAWNGKEDSAPPSTPGLWGRTRNLLARVGAGAGAAFRGHHKVVTFLEAGDLGLTFWEHGLHPVVKHVDAYGPAASVCSLSL